MEAGGMTEVRQPPCTADCVGPWSTAAVCGLPLPPVYGLKGNSVVLETADVISADALFVDLVTADGAEFTLRVGRTSVYKYLDGVHLAA
jgi:hypothetical protein